MNIASSVHHQVLLMTWKGALFSLSFLLTLVKSSGRSVTISLLDLGAGKTLLYTWTICSASLFVLVALVLSMYLLFEHLSAYNQPEEQKFLIGLILMVPVYALESFLSLLDSNAAFNYEVIRDCYEAFALYCFERYLIACLGLGISLSNFIYGIPWSLMFVAYRSADKKQNKIKQKMTAVMIPFIPVDLASFNFTSGEERTIAFMESQSLVTSSFPLLEEAYTYGVVEHPFPLKFLMRDWQLGSDFYQAVKIGIVQYMILKMICAVLAMVFEFFGVYGEGKFEWRYAYPYLSVVLNFSQTWALYCLVQFYSVIKDKLAPIKPLAKFLTFKSIVFLTWWQGLAVAFLFSMGAFKGALAQELKTRIQDYIICIEMGVAAVVHLYVFPAVPYKRGERCVRNVAVMTDYASLGTPPDPEEVRDCERSTRVCVAHHEREKRMNLPQSVRDVVLGSGEIIVDDMKFTVSHVVEPVERGFAKINRTFNQISENVKRFEEQRKKSKDDSYLIPLNSWSTEFSEMQDNLIEGSVSDSGLPDVKRPSDKSKATASRFRHR